MEKWGRFKSSFDKVKKPFRHVKKVHNIKWLLPGWLIYEFYKVHKNKGHTGVMSLSYGAKAEAMRLALMASIPLPGTYELTTTGLALLKRKIENNEVEKLTLNGFKHFIPIKKFHVQKKDIVGKPHLRIFYKERHIYFEIFYKKK